MYKALQNWVVTSLVIMIVAYFLPSMVYVTDFWVAMKVALVLAIVNIFIKPVLSLLAFPITVLTLGLFGFVINALLVMLVASWLHGFIVYGFFSALVFSLILSFVTDILKRTQSGRGSRGMIYERAKMRD